jgi:hypothetical protein
VRYTLRLRSWKITSVIVSGDGELSSVAGRSDPARMRAGDRMAAATRRSEERFPLRWPRQVGTRGRTERLAQLDGLHVLGTATHDYRAGGRELVLTLEGIPVQPLASQVHSQTRGCSPNPWPMGIRPPRARILGTLSWL